MPVNQSRLPQRPANPPRLSRLLFKFGARRLPVVGRSWFSALFWGAALGWGCMGSASAAERVVVQFGPLKPSVSIADLESFAATGEIPNGLKLYTPLLTPEVQQLLSSQLQLDPNVGDKLIEDLLHTSAGERFLNTLQAAIPDSDPFELKVALSRATQQAGGFSFISFLQSFPSQTITIDAASTIALASQMNLPQWQSQALSSVMERELRVKSPPVKAGFDPTATGNRWVWKQTLTFHDFDRDRTIPADIYWTQWTQGPLIVISHGFGADRRFLGYLAHHLASYGFTVVALEHPASNVTWLTQSTLTYSRGRSLGNILPATEFIDRPKDVSFLLDRLDRLNHFSASLNGKFNTKEVTVIGHSLGGYTALALAGATLNLKHLRQFCSSPSPVMLSPADLLQCNAADLSTQESISLKDDRIVQTIVLNPVIGRLFNEASLAQVKVPTLMVSGTSDSITPAISQQFLPFTQLHSPKYLLTAIGATHLSVGDPNNLNHALTQNVFLRERQDEETAALRRLLRGVSLAFVKQRTAEARRYAPFLSPAYAQAFSTADLKLRLNSELPPNFANWLTMAALPLEQFVSTTLVDRPPQPQWQQQCNAKLGCLLSSLPLVMFILPGGLPIALSATKLLAADSLWKRKRRF